MLANNSLRKAKVSAGALLGIAVLALTVGAADAKDKITISLIQILTSQEWAGEIAAGARAAAADMGSDKVDLRIAGPAGYDLQKEAQVALSEAERGTDAVILSNAGGMIEPAHLIVQKGIPLTWIVGGPVDEVTDAFYVGVDPYEIGQAGADLIIPALEKKHGKPASEISGEVVQGICTPGLPILALRLTAIDDAVAKRMPKAKILPTFESKVDLAQNYAAWNQAINKYPKALFYSDPCEDGNKNIQKIRAEDKIDVPQVYYDNPESARVAVKNGEITGIVSSNRFTEGYVAVYVTARALLKQQKFPVGWLKVPHKVITSANADAYIAAWENRGAGLRKFYDGEIVATRDLPLESLPPTSAYNHPPK
jgi:ribose transport system substrate-binding protein